MSEAARPSPVGFWIERALAVLVVGSLVWALIYLFRFDHLPQPYFYVPEDSFMDWVNTAHYAHNPGAYDEWGTIYPPLSFVFLKFLTSETCYRTAEWYSSRDCDLYGLFTLHLIFFVNLALIAKTFLKTDRSTALPRILALGLGYPMTFALERGNIVLLCFTCVLLAYGPLLRSARLRWLFAAFAINLKVYLVGTLFAQLLRQRWRWFEGALITTVIVYLLSYAFMGAGSPMQIYGNIKLFGELTAAANPLDLWNPVTYRPAISLLDSDFPVSDYIGSRATDIATIALPMAIYITQAIILAAAAAIWFRPKVVPMHRAVLLSIAMALVTSEAGSYTQVFLILFVFMEPWRGFGRIWSIIACYILCFGNDIVSVYDIPTVVRSGFLGKREIMAEYSVGIMPFIRPGVVLSIAIAMSLVTIRDVWADARAHGWRSPFRRGDPLPASAS